MRNKILLGLILALALTACSNTAENENESKPTSDNVTNQEKKDTGKTLDLSGKNLTQVDMSVFENTGLIELDLSNNNLTGALPSQIGKLKKLKRLDLSDNQMTGVPAEIGQLSDLEELDLSNNQLTGLPNELANLSNLKVLNLAGNEYSVQDLAIIRQGLPNAEFILD